MIVRSSPNFDDRQGPIDMLLFHYTDMLSAEAALQRLCDPLAKVSAHYLIDEEGNIVQLVHDAKRAWHAGQSYWQGVTDINGCSIGIELANPGHTNGYRSFPAAQMQSLVTLSRQLLSRYAIKRDRVLGHSDVAPMRKLDPGEKLDWSYLAREGIGLYYTDPRPVNWNDDRFFEALIHYGYDPAAGREKLTEAFCRHFRSGLLTKAPDQELKNILAALIDATEKAA